MVVAMTMGAVVRIMTRMNRIKIPVIAVGMITGERYSYE
jgi:hypothetical protein